MATLPSSPTPAARVSVWNALLLLTLLGRSLGAEAPELEDSLKAPKAPNLSTVKVTEVFVPGVSAEKKSADTVRAGIDDIVVVKVVNLDSLVRRAKCLSADDRTVPDCGKSKIALYLDGREMRGLFPESGAPLPDEGLLQFHLRRTADSVNNETWADLLGGPGLKGEDFYYRAAQVSVGLEDGYPLPTDVRDGRFVLIRLHRTWFIICGLALALILVFLAWTAMYTDVLRDVGGPPTNRIPMKLLFKGRSKQARKPYSLGRVQMAFWFVLVIAAFLFIWLVTGAHDTITPSVLGLIGIGALTALGAAAIDIGKESSDSGELSSLEAEVEPLEKEIEALDTAITTAAALPDKVAALAAERTLKEKRQAEINERIENLKSATAAETSEGFLHDILKEPNGTYGFHRFQMAVWTLILGLLFLRAVWQRLAMPEFSATLLALLGISAGTYVGFKFPEKKS